MATTAGPFGLAEMKVENFSGLNTLLDPTNLPSFASPDCNDVEFFPGQVKTRPGLVTQFTEPFNPTFNYLKTYITNAEAVRMLALGSFGDFYVENPQGTLTAEALVETPGCYGNSVSLFGREYLALGDGKFGSAIPRQWNDVNFDRVSQIGPGASPTAGDEVGTIAIASVSQEASIPVIAAFEFVPFLSLVSSSITVGAPRLHVAPGSIFTIAGVGTDYNGSWPTPPTTPTGGSSFTTTVDFFFNNPVNPTPNIGAGGTIASSFSTFVTATPHGLVVGQSAIVAGVGAGYDGTWTVMEVPDATHFSVFVGSTGLAALGAGGTIALAGHVEAGTHQLTCMFITRSGYITAPSPPTSWTAAGGKRVAVTNIPIGPPNVIGRIIAFTGVAGDTFFYINPGDPAIFSSQTQINDNTTTSAIFDFDDLTLESGTNIDTQFELLELGKCSGVSEYHERLFWTGELNKIDNLLNMSFDGGWNIGAGVSSTDVPMGWVQGVPNNVAPSAGGSRIASTIFGYAYQITGDGVTAVLGEISQPAALDYLGNPIININTAYSVRMMLEQNGDLAAGNAIVDLYSPTAGLLGVATVAASSIGTTYKSFTVPLITAQASLPADLVLRIYANGTPTSGGSIIFDNVEIFPTLQPFNISQVRASSTEQPESYDGVTGFLTVAQDNGQAVTSSFVLRDYLYFVKERSLYVTQDNGDEPSTWSINEVSSRVGSPSVRGVGLGDEWAVIASRDGLFNFNGSLSAAWTGGESSSKLSTEIQPTWDAINWQYGFTIDVKVDIRRKRIYVAVPMGTATVPNVMLVLDFTDGFGDPLSQGGAGRKWTIWNIPCNSMNFIERNDGTQKFFIGNNTHTGKIYQLTDGVYNDDGAAIASYWQSGFFSDTGRLSFEYVSANIVGAGVSDLLIRRGDQNDLKVVRGWNLVSDGFNNQERNIQTVRERMAIRVGTSVADSFFSLQGMTMYVRPSTWSPLRGSNY